MSAQNLIEQHIVFTAPQFVDLFALLANSFIASIPANSVTGLLYFPSNIVPTTQWDGRNMSNFISIDIYCYVTTSFQQTIQQNIAALQAAFPGYVVSTYGVNTSFGN